MSQQPAGAGGHHSGFPLNDTVCKLISLIHKKSQSLGAYDCNKDGENSGELSEFFTKMREADESALKELACKLRTELNKEFCQSSQSTGESDPLINCTALPLPKEEAIAKVENLKEDQLVDENEAIEGVKRAAQ